MISVDERLRTYVCTVLYVLCFLVRVTLFIPFPPYLHMLAQRTVQPTPDRINFSQNVKGSTVSSIAIMSISFI